MDPDCPIRLLLSGSLGFGPGKAELLEKISTLGSLQAAASDMEMSYMKAWKIIKGLNERFAEPLVVLHRGGVAQGGAELTTTGLKILELYQKAIRAAVTSTAPHLAKMQAMLREHE